VFFFDLKKEVADTLPGQIEREKNSTRQRGFTKKRREGTLFTPMSGRSREGGLGEISGERGGLLDPEEGWRWECRRRPSFNLVRGRRGRGIKSVLIAKSVIGDPGASNFLQGGHSLKEMIIKGKSRPEPGLHNLKIVYSFC